MNKLGPKSLSGRKISDGIDYFETPAWATRKLLEFEEFEGRILEPCCGNGAICNVLLEQGIHRDNVRGSDLRTDDAVWGQRGVDFRKSNLPNNSFHNIITNPPFYCSQ